MNRYIDADAVIMALRLEYPMMPMFKESQKEWEIKTEGYRKAEEVIKDAPSIDIVRCKECKHWERLNYEAPKEGWCDDEMPYSDGRWVDADDFCSYGERE